MTKQHLILLEWNISFEEDNMPNFMITLEDNIIDEEEFSELLCDFCNDYLEEQHQTLVDEIPDSLLDN